MKLRLVGGIYFLALEIRTVHSCEGFIKSTARGSRQKACELRTNLCEADPTFCTG